VCVLICGKSSLHRIQAYLKERVQLFVVTNYFALWFRRESVNILLSLPKTGRKLFVL
jgi:hypothetical protein